VDEVFYGKSSGARDRPKKRSFETMTDVDNTEPTANPVLGTPVENIDGGTESDKLQAPAAERIGTKSISNLGIKRTTAIATQYGNTVVNKTKETTASVEMEGPAAKKRKINHSTAITATFDGRVVPSEDNTIVTVESKQPPAKKQRIDLDKTNPAAFDGRMVLWKDNTAFFALTKRLSVQEQSMDQKTSEEASWKHNAALSVTTRRPGQKPADTRPDDAGVPEARRMAVILHMLGPHGGEWDRALMWATGVPQGRVFVGTQDGPPWAVSVELLRQLKQLRGGC
jgi:hypothetical protein